MACSATFLLFYLLVGIPIFVLYVYTFVWVHRISQQSGNCECSNNWRRTFLYVYFIYVLIFFIANTIYILSHGCSTFTDPPVIMQLLSIAGLILNVLFIISALQYVKLLKRRKCACATQGHGHHVLTALAIIQIITLAVVTLITLYAVFVIIVLIRSLQKMKVIKK